MAFDEELAGRIRVRLGKHPGVTEKRMFGGVVFLANGNMACGVHGAEMIVRLDPADTDAALAREDTRVFDLSGRPMRGWILVRPVGLRTDAAVSKWVDAGMRYAGSLPPKH